MSTLHLHRRHQITELRFGVYDESFSATILERPYIVRDSAGAFVDSYRSEHAAECYCKALNSGRADVHPHRVIGCRVETLGYVR